MALSVIVVGGGILGTATAFRLVQAGARVTLLEAGLLGQGASAVGFGWLNANDKPPIAYHQLNTTGMREYARLRRELGAASWLHETGSVEWLRATARPVPLRDKVAHLREWGYAVELLPVRELRRLEPDLVPPSDLEEFAFFPDEAYVDLLSLIGVLLGVARETGATIRTQTKVVGLTRHGDRVVGVETERGERLPADLVVCCGGRRSNELARMVGFDLPMASNTGMTVVLAPSATRLRGLFHDGELNIRPDGAGRVMIGHDPRFDDQVSPGEPVPPTVTAALRDCAAKVLPGLAGVPVETARVTVRPIPGDSFPIVGPMPEVGGLYLLTTHSGATLGPLLGRMVAAEIMDGVIDPRLATFRPDRVMVG